MNCFTPAWVSFAEGGNLLARRPSANGRLEVPRREEDEQNEADHDCEGDVEEDQRDEEADG